MNAIQKLIEDLKNDPEQAQVASDLIVALEEKQEELGDNPTDEAVEKAIQECIMAQLAGALGGIDISGDIDDSDREYMKDSCQAVKDVFSEEEWHYAEREVRPDLIMYELGFGMKKCNLRMRVSIEARPRVCRLDAILPITADETYDYVLCKAIVRENYPRRYGALQYDERDGEMSYRYSYPINHGLHKDDFKMVFLAVASSASDSYDIIKRCCVGRFKTKEINEILRKVNDLVEDLSDEG